jgi:hypothetical protein
MLEYYQKKKMLLELKLYNSVEHDPPDFVSSPTRAGLLRSSEASGSVLIPKLLTF